MKILYVVNGYPTKKLPEFCVFTKEQIDCIKATEQISSELIFINAREKGFMEYFKTIPKLRSKLAYFDIVHCFHGLTFILIFFMVPRKKIIVSFLNSIENEYSGNNKWLTKSLILLTKLITKRKNVFGIFKDKIPEFLAKTKRAFYLPNGTNINMFYSKDKSESKLALGLDVNKRYILFVSSRDRYRRQKRYDRFQDVLELLRKEYKIKDIEELILSGVSRNKVLDYFNAAEIHLLTSDFEGSPNSIKEAMACNLPIVSTKVGNIEKMFNGFPLESFVSNSFEARDIAILASNLLKNKCEKTNFRNILIRNGLDSESKTQELIKIYKKVYES